MNRSFRLEWLDYTTSLVADGFEGRRLNGKLEDYLLFELPPTATVEARRSLAKICKGVAIEGNDRLALYYSNLIINFPLFAETARLVCRYDAMIQDDFSDKIIAQAMFDRHGETPQIKRAVNNTFETLVNLGLLKRTPKETYEVCKIPIRDKDTIFKLVSAEIARKGYIEFEQIMYNKRISLFDYNFTQEDIANCGKFAIGRHGGVLTIEVL